MRRKSLRSSVPLRSSTNLISSMNWNLNPRSSSLEGSSTLRRARSSSIRNLKSILTLDQLSQLSKWTRLTECLGLINGTQSLLKLECLLFSSELIVLPASARNELFYLNKKSTFSCQTLKENFIRIERTCLNLFSSVIYPLFYFTPLKISSVFLLWNIIFYKITTFHFQNELRVFWVNYQVEAEEAWWGRKKQV